MHRARCAVVPHIEDNFFLCLGGVKAVFLEPELNSNSIVKVTLKVGDTTQQVDFKNRILLTSLTGSATYTHIAKAMREELQSVFDDSIYVTQSSGVFTIGTIIPDAPKSKALAT